MSGTFGKIFEYVLVNNLDFTPSTYQFGYTTGLSPIMTGLLVSEAKHDGSEGLFFTTMDNQKASGVVHRTILLEKLAQKGVN